jgi:predicted aconitase with swiveling domain
VRRAILKSAISPRSTVSGHRAALVIREAERISAVQAVTLEIPFAELGPDSAPCCD